MQTPQKHKKDPKKIFGSKYKRIFLILFLDIALAVGAFAIASAITLNSRGEAILWPDYIMSGYDAIRNIALFRTHIVWIGAVFVCLTVGMLAAFDSYNSVWRYAGRVEFFKLIISYFASGGAIFLFAFFMRLFFDILIPSVTILLYSFFSLFFSALVRYQSGIRQYLVHLKNRVSNNTGDFKQTNVNLRTLVIGAGFSGSQFIEKALANQTDESFIPVALLDEDKDKHGTKVHNIRIEGGMEKLAQTIKKYRIEAIVIAIVKINKAKLKELYAECARHNLPIKVMTAL